MGWMAAHLLTRDDRDGANTLYNIDHLLELWEHVHAQVPNARLWLIGGASARVTQRVAGREDIVLFGRLPRERALADASNFDVSVYARERDQGIRAAKIGEMIGLGSSDRLVRLRGDERPRETGAGFLVGTTRGIRATQSFTCSRTSRSARRLAAAARRAGRELDWDVLAARFEREVLDLSAALAVYASRPRPHRAAAGQLAPQTRALPVVEAETPDRERAAERPSRPEHRQRESVSGATGGRARRARQPPRASAGSTGRTIARARLAAVDVAAGAAMRGRM